MIKTKQSTTEASPRRFISYSSFGDVANTWGLQRIHQMIPSNDESGLFQVFATGAGVDIYVVDSGVRADHSELTDSSNFKSRVEVLFDAYDSLNQSKGEDTLGHGTHVASIAAGNFVGVASGARILNVRVFESKAVSLADNVLDGLNAVLRHHKEKNGMRPSVANLSLSIPKNTRIDKKVEELVAAGIVCLAAAGDHGQPASSFSPAGLESVITVAGVDRSDKPLCVYTESNSGPLVDIMAPGFEIEAASKSGPQQYHVLSGSSIACAYASGLAACYLELNPHASPKQVRDYLVSTAVKSESLPAPRLFNQMQNLAPRWSTSQSAFIGVFTVGQDVDMKFNCERVTPEEIEFKIIRGHLPAGLSLMANGEIRGQVASENLVDQKPSHFSFIVRCQSSSGFSDRLFYAAIGEAGALNPVDFEDRHMVQLSKVVASGSGSCS